jgi:hypothetical protein
MGLGRAAMADSLVPAGSSAMLIGVSAYEYAELAPIRAARNSLLAMRSLLLDPELGGWAAGQVRVIANPLSAADLSAEIAEVAVATTGVLLLYYVGHGVRSDQGELCLSGTATDPDQPEVSGLPWRKLADTLRGSPAHTRLSILDCGFGGQAGSGPLAVIPNCYTLAAVGPDEWAAKPEPGPPEAACTAFTAELRDLVVAGLPGRAPWLTFGDLYPVLRERLLAQGLPAPSEQGSGAAREFAFTANAALPGRSRPRVPVASPGGRAATPSAGLPPTRLPSAAPLTAPARATAPAPLEVAPAVAAVPAPVLPVRPAVDRAQVERLVSEALRVANSVPESPPKAQALLAVAAVVRSGDPGRAARLVADACRVAESIRDSEPRARALAAVSGPLAIVDVHVAETVARSLPEVAWKASALARVAANVAAGDPGRASQLIAEAERGAQSAPGRDQQASALADVTAAVAVIDPDRAEQVAQSIPAPDQKASALAALAGAVLGTDPDRAGRLIADAERLARPLPGASARAPAMAAVAKVMAALDVTRATRVIADAERSAMSIPGTDRRASALAAVAGALAAVDPEHAEQLARSITSTAWQAAALAEVAATLVSA